MIPPATMARLATLGLSADQAAAVAEMMSEVEAATEAKISSADAAREEARLARVRDGNRERKARERGRHAVSRVTLRDPSPSLPSSTPPTNTTLPGSSFASLRKIRSGREPEGFAEFWQAFPHKVSKPQAVKAFAAVMRDRRATLAEILAGLERYIQAKPPDRMWLNPATFLNGDRWADQPDEPPLLTVPSAGRSARAPPVNSRFEAADLAERYFAERTHHD